MRILSNKSIIPHLRRALSRRPSLPALSRCPSLPVPPSRSLHDLPALPSSRILQPPPTPPTPAPAPADDEAMNEFLSRFAWSVRSKLSAAFPGVPRETLNGMLLVICQKVVDAMDHPGAPTPTPTDPSTDLDLSPDLWTTIWEVSNQVHQDMRRDRMRAELKKYLHCDDVKEMCRFAGDVGIRGSFLRELRVKWAKEKLEEVDFYKELEQVRAQAAKEEEASTAPEIEMSPVVLTALPQRRGKITYKIYGLDLSGQEWAEVAEKAAEAEKQFVPEEAQPIVGRCKKVDDRILALDAEKDDPVPVLAEWAEILKPKRVDWLALLKRVGERNVDLYFKIVDHLLTEESFEANVRDYSRLIDAHFKAGRLGDAESVLQKMIERGITPDVLTSNLLVHMYSTAGDVDRAKHEFENLKKHGFQPDLKTYGSMITAYVKAGLPKQAETILRDMDWKNIKPTKEMYMEVLRAFSERGQVDGAQRIINTMQFAGGLQLTLESSTLLVEAFTQAGDPDQARGHFDHMIRWGIRPDDRCTASMIAAYVKKNLLDKALELLLTLEKDGLEPGIATYTVMVDWMGRLLLVEEAERLVSVIREKGEAPFEIHVSLCDMYARAGEEEKARRSLKVLEGRKELLRGDQFERVGSGLLEGGLPEEARKVAELMQAQGFTPSETFRGALMAAQTMPRQNQTMSPNQSVLRQQNQPLTRRGGKP